MIDLQKYYMYIKKILDNGENYLDKEHKQALEYCLKLLVEKEMEVDNAWMDRNYSTNS